MKIKITDHVPTKPSPVIGKAYEVVKIEKQRHGRMVYFVECEGQEIGVLQHEMTIVEK
jgi:hypothetical protein